MLHNRTSPWLLAAGAAAAGLVVTGAVLSRRRARSGLFGKPSRSRFESLEAQLDDLSSERDATQSLSDKNAEALRSEQKRYADMPVAAREALEASSRVHGIRSFGGAASGEFSQNIADRTRTRQEQRSHEAGRNPWEDSGAITQQLALDDADIGQALNPSEVPEVPLGVSADPEIENLLTTPGRAQATDSTGASVLDASSDLADSHEQINPATEDLPEITAQPTRNYAPSDDAYDDVSPEDLGAEYLLRATQGATAPHEADLAALPPELYQEEGLSVVSEESISTAQADVMEEDVAMRMRARKPKPADVRPPSSDPEPNDAERE
ncbi:MAG TPA: hypothetical protein VFQ61_12415 [Polyangiaceae bacterium]|nr:hypothetical protein [Polyangiaceae bacterium]